MSVSEVITIVIILVVLLGYLYLKTLRKIAANRSLTSIFLRVTIGRKDSDKDEKNETVKDFREQISIMEQLLASMKSIYAHTAL